MSREFDTALVRLYCSKCHDGPKFGPSAKEPFRSLCGDCASLLFYRIKIANGQKASPPPAYAKKWAYIQDNFRGALWKKNPWLALRALLGFG